MATSDEYLNTIERLESGLALMDQRTTGASIGISLKRIADALDVLVAINTQPKITMIGPTIVGPNVNDVINATQRLSEEVSARADKESGRAEDD